MQSNRKRSADGLDRITADLVKIGKTTLVSDAASSRTLHLPDEDGTLVTAAGVSGEFVNLTTNQNIGGVKTFTSPPVITSIENSGTLVVPTGGGTIAKVSDTVDLTNPQNITGLKTVSKFNFAAGTAALPSIGVGATNQGIYSTGANVIVGTGGAARLTVSNGTTNSQGRLVINQGGTSVAPAFYFITDTSSGIFRPVANQLGFSISGTQLLNLSASGTRLGAVGTPISNFQFGSFTTSAVITAGSQITFPSIAITGFSTVPNVIFAVRTPSGGAQNWDRVMLSLNGGSTSSSLLIYGVNTSASSTSGTATISWQAWV